MKDRSSGMGRLAATFAIMLMLSLGAAAGAGAEPADAQAIAALRYEVTAEKSKIALGQELDLEVRLHNDGEVPMTVLWPDDPCIDVYCFSITSPEGQPTPPPRGPSAPVGLAKQFKVAQPGDFLRKRVSLAMPALPWYCQEYCFPQPGQYTIRPSFHVALDTSFDPEVGQWAGTLEAPPLEIDVVASSLKTDAAGVRITGQAVDLDGRPVEGAIVDVTGREVDARVFSGSDGRFAMGVLMGTDPFIDIGCTHPDYCESRLRLTPQGSKRDYELRLVMDPGLTLRGRVVDESGQGVVGARVGAHGGSGKWAFTGEGGTFELRGASSQEVWVDKTGYRWVRPHVPTERTEGGDWKVVMRRSMPAPVSGRARFRSERPAADHVLWLALKDPNAGRYPDRARTRDDGQFEVSVSSVGRANGTCWLEEREDYGTGIVRCWRIPVDGLPLPAEGIGLVFDDTRAIDVSVEPANELPADAEFVVHCAIQGDREREWRPVAVEPLGPASGTVHFGRLSPGRYRTRVFTSIGPGSWTQDVEVPQDRETPAVTVRYLLPELPTDGPPVGEGYPDGDRPEAPAPGTIAGRVLYDDGSPAVGAAIVGDRLQLEPVALDGHFHVAAPAGRTALAVSLMDATGWPESLGPGLETVVGPYGSDPNPARLRPDTVLLPVEVQAGQTVEQEVVLRREGLRTVRLDWEGDPAAGLDCSVRVEGGGQWFVRSAFVRGTRGGAAALEDIPTGQGVVIVRSDDYAGIAKLTAETGDALLSFDPADAGRIFGRAKRAEGTAAARVVVGIRPALLPEIVPAPDANGLFPIPRGDVVLRAGEDGTFLSPRLSPGSYFVRTEPDGSSEEATVEVRSGETSDMALTTSAPSRGLPPLRNADARTPSDPGAPTCATLLEAARVLLDAHVTTRQRDARGLRYLVLVLRPGDPDTREPMRFWLMGPGPGSRPLAAAYPRSLPGVYLTIGAMSVNGSYPETWVDERGLLMTTHSMRRLSSMPSGLWLIDPGSTTARCILTDDAGNSVQVRLRPG